MQPLYTSKTPVMPAVPGKPGKNHLSQLLPLQEYDHIIVLFSGGKDSLAVLLHLLELGVPKEKILLFHHDIDGGHPELNMDWPCTASYVEAVAAALGIELNISWREHGFWGEVYRLGASRPVLCEQAGEVYLLPKSPAQLQSEALRQMPQTPEIKAQLEKWGSRENYPFPAKTADLKKRWCSSILKIMVGNALIRYLPQLNNGAKKLLITSGERREESASRSHYNEMEIHSTNATAKMNRLVHHWRPVIDWAESSVWQIIQRHSILPHPCYYAGWNRCSCAACIFGLPKHWAGIKELLPHYYTQFRQAEVDLGFTVDNKKNLDEYTANAPSCVCYARPDMLALLLQYGSIQPGHIITNKWELPAGAYNGTKGGPC